MIGKLALCTAIAAAYATGGCASSYPPPTQRMADTLAAMRAAEEVGANGNPQGQLHLRLAQEELRNAKTLVDSNDNQRADYVLLRAKADAELALAEAREGKAIADARNAAQQADQLHTAVTNAQPPGIVPAPPMAPAAPVLAPSPALSPNGGSR